MVDFQKIVRELEEHMTQEQIGDAVGITSSSVSMLSRGQNKEPRYSTGYQLIILHRKMMRKAKLAEGRTSP